MPLKQAQIEQFREKGFVIVEDVLKDEDFRPIEHDYDVLINQKAQHMLDDGLIQSTHAEKPFSHRLAAVAAELSDEEYEKFRGFTSEIDIMKARVKPLFEFFFNRRLLSAVESIVGPEITLSPIQHIRPYLPSRNDKQPMQVPWHQDQGVTKQEADISEILTVWIPLVDVAPVTGCLQVLPGVVPMGLLAHQREGGTMIKPDHMPGVEPIDCSMKRGDLLFMSAYTPHRGQVNRTDKVRWSMDLRFQKTGTPTGRPFWPEFIVQSKSNPTSVQNDFDTWCRRWVTDLKNSKGMHLHRV
ncbi:MAG: phytanoyl-CoA dioxygenase family protein [bacterium]|jgi:phytanoyl-CoA hydroxylase|nr:phytanoyl-CoA dioxygenase family protein [bacterium]